MALEAPRRLRFRRLGAPVTEKKVEDEFIQKNLEQLKANAEKKKRAQQAYYENNFNNCDASPLSRDSSRKPVKLRLGRRIPFNGTNTSAIPPKQRLRVRRIGTLNNSINHRKTKMHSFTVQHKMNQFRARQQSSGVQAPGGPRRLRLKRLVNNMSNGLVNMPKNLRVQVRNNTGFEDKSHLYQHNPHRFRQILNHEVQMEIRRIQMDFQGTTITPMMIRPVSTKISTSVRFGALQ